MEQRKPISAEEFLSRATQIIDISGWEPGETIPVKVRRASLTSLITSGQVPNSLLKFAYREEASAPVLSKENPTAVAEAMALIDAVAKAVLLEPSWEEVGEFLTDNQKMDLFNYAQGGLKALESFRERPGAGPAASGGGEGVRQEA